MKLSSATVTSDGALARDGYIYAFTYYGRVLKIHTINNYNGFVGNIIQSDPVGGFGVGMMLSWDLMVASIGHQRTMPDVI